MATRIVFANGQEIVVAEDEADVIGAVRREHPNPVKLESTIGGRLHLNGGRGTAVADYRPDSHDAADDERGWRAYGRCPVSKIPTGGPPMTRTMTRWQPFADPTDLRSRFDRMLADLSDGERGGWTLELDVVEEQDKHYVRRERRYGSFTRTLTLPENAKRDEIDAACHDGVLEVTIPLAEAPKHEARTITPKAA